MLSAVFREMFKIPVHFPLNAHNISLFYTHTLTCLPTDIYRYTNEYTAHKQINLFADSQICVRAHMQLLSFLLPFSSWQTNSYMHKHSPLLPDLSVYSSAPVAMPFSLFHSLYPSLCFLFPSPSSLSVWIIQSSAGVESSHKLENTMNDSRMFK